MEWVIKPLGELVTFERGLTYSKSDEAEFSSNGVLRSNNVDLETNSLNLDEIKYLKADFVIPSSKKVVRNSLLMCMSNGSKSHLGKVALIEDDLGYAFGGFMGLLKPIDTVVLPRYLYYSLISPAYKKHIQSLSDGANINNLKYKDLSVFPVMLPTSLSEQQRIVDILDAEFAKIDALKENAEKNLQNAKDLFQAVLRKELEPKEGWDVSTLKEQLKLTSGDNLTAKSIITGDYPVYGGNGIMGYHNRYNLDGLNVLVGRVGALCGNVRLIEGKIWFTDNCFLVHDKTGVFHLPYLAYALQNANLRQYATQAAQPVVSNASMKDVQLSIPPTVKEQCKIVYMLDKIKENSEVLQHNYDKTIILCNDLKQALLRKAFNGEL